MDEFSTRQHLISSEDVSSDTEKKRFSYGDEEVDLYGLLDSEESGDTKVSKRLQSFIDIAEEAFSEKQNAVFTRAYTLKHIEIVANFDNSVHLDNKGLTGSQLTTDISISELFEFVKKYDAKFTPKPANPIFLNEDGTPRVYYHGTDAEFTEFDRTKSTKKHFNVLGEGNYFTYRKSAAERYGQNVINAYLKADNLYIKKDGFVLVADQINEEHAQRIELILDVAQKNPIYPIEDVAGEIAAVVKDAFSEGDFVVDAHAEERTEIFDALRGFKKTYLTRDQLKTLESRIKRHSRIGCGVTFSSVFLQSYIRPQG